MSKKPYDWPDQWEDEKEIIGVTESAVFPDHVNKENYKPRTIVDKTLEILDPTPNIYTLFVQFNSKFFWNALLSVEVKWSNRMTTCAGTCSFHPRNRECVITLSAPLLKLRPRKDLVETLLHEMIHGYLFLTSNNRDRDGHGPEFCKHMKRINDSAGTAISIYHTFHDEVKLYKQHWWRCNGPCQHRAPYFGNVRRAMNRAPGPNDTWWKEHERNCNGTFIKIKEPTKDDKPTNKKDDKKIPNSQKSPMDKFVTITKDPSNSNNIVSKPSTSSSSSGFVKLGTNTNKVHGFGTGGPGSTSSLKSVTSSTSTSTSTKSPSFSCSGTLGGAGNGKSNLLEKYLTPKNDVKSKNGFASTNYDKPISLISPPKKKPSSLAVLLTPSPQ
ncbi:hypothetical protein HCN44_001482 [Aphidius gifuensis]|uniref:SprT-like domain-containing protein n=1 Tax=Aphidius gifuensis TaxID=684658 RepID=A0A834XT83_APHGI|nr:hypothetical protein HCN44_001482 [Aphidius gifuensis]